jgi:hypothetical protein
MATDTLEVKEHAHKLIDQLGPGQIEAVVRLLEVMVDDDDELTEEDRRAVAASREYFRRGGEGLTFEQVVAECGLSIDEIQKP